MKIVIPGDPEEQPRLRHFYRGGAVRFWDPSKKEKDCLKKMLQDALFEQCPGYFFPRNPRISLYFYCKIPASMTKALRKHAEVGLLRKRTRPDCDNYVKLYFDCMNEILIEDDCQASIGEVEKFYHSEPKTVIYIEETKDILDMPLDEIPRYSESCEWIRAKRACPLGYIGPHFEDSVIFLGE